jgi:hypothetical protein
MLASKNPDTIATKLGHLKNTKTGGYKRKTNKKKRTTKNKRKTRRST